MVSLEERQPGTELRRCLGVEAIGDVMRRGTLRWHGGMDTLKERTILIM